MEEADDLFVSSSVNTVKIKKEPGLEDASFTNSINIPQAVPARTASASNSTSITTDTTSKLAKVSIQPQSIVSGKSDRRFRSTSETLNSLYESSHAIPIDSTPELVLNDEDDDEIVLEYPVYYSNEYLEKLYLLQYPTRPAVRPFVDAKGSGIIDSRIKPKSQVFEVDVPIETSHFYDKEKGDNWGGLNKQVFSGVAKSAEGSMIGVFKDNELHLNPIHATAQLRPQFSYISQPPVPVGEAVGSSSVVDQEKAKANAPKIGPKAVHLSAKIVGDNAPSFSGALTARKKMEDEDFVKLEWFDRDSEESWAISDHLVTEAKEHTIPMMDSREYIEKISSPHIDPLEASRLAAEAALAAQKHQAELAAARQKAILAANKNRASNSKQTTARVPTRRSDKK